MNRLNQVPRYPVDAFEPVISVGGNDFDRVISWFTLTTKPGNNRDMASYQDFVDDTVLTRIERVPDAPDIVLPVDRTALVPDGSLAGGAGGSAQRRPGRRTGWRPCRRQAGCKGRSRCWRHRRRSKRPAKA